MVSTDLVATLVSCMRWCYINFSDTFKPLNFYTLMPLNPDTFKQDKQEPRAVNNLALVTPQPYVI